MLYEMLAGKVPFTGETINHTIVAILENEPKMLENVPDELQRIVRKSMAKDTDMRYQTARDLLIDPKDPGRTLDIQVNSNVRKFRTEETPLFRATMFRFGGYTRLWMQGWFDRTAPKK